MSELMAWFESGVGGAVGAALVLVLSYLLGAISFARIIGSRVIPDEDLDNLTVPIGETGEQFRATSVSASVIRLKAGPKWGCLTSILDMLKATAPVVVLRLAFPESPIFLYAGAAVVVGHNFPVYYRFKGGRGISSIYGGLFVIDWLAIPVTTLFGSLISLFVLRYAIVMYFGVTLAMIPWLWFRFADIHYLIYALIVNVCFWIASIPELTEYIRHLRKGDFDGEYRLIGTGRTMDNAVARWIRKRREKRVRRYED